MKATPLVLSNAFVKEADPTRNYAGPHGYLNIEGGDGTRQYSFLHVRNPLPDQSGVTLQSATLWLKVRNPGAGWAGGPYTVTVRRVTASWGITSLTYAKMPATTTATSSVSVTDGNVAGRDDNWVPIDVTDLLASPYYGFRLGSDADHVVSFHSAQCDDLDNRPYLEVAWTVRPLRPSSIAPDGGRAVGTPATSIDYEFRSADNDDEVTAHQFRFYTDESMSSLYWDSGELAATLPWLDLADTSFPAMVDNQQLWGQVRAKGSDGVWSNFSDSFTFRYVNKGTVTILSPEDDGSGAVTVTDITPVVVYEFTPSAHGGAITERQVWVSSDGDNVWDSGRQRTDDATDSVTIGTGVIDGDGWSGTLHVRAWDSTERQYRSGDATYTYKMLPITYYRSTSGVDPVDTLTVDRDGPILVLTFTRSTAPDRFGLRINGKLVEDDLDPADYLVATPSPHYQVRYGGGKPNTDATYEVVAIENNKESAGNPQVVYNLSILEYWLIAANGMTVPFLVPTGAAMSIGEISSAVDTIGGRAPVVQTNAWRGYEGTLSGYLISADPNDDDSAGWRDNLMQIKSYRNTMPTRLLFHDHNFPVALGPLAGPSESDIPLLYTASVPFWQIAGFEVRQHSYIFEPQVLT